MEFLSAVGDGCTVYIGSVRSATVLAECQPLGDIINRNIIQC